MGEPAVQKEQSVMTNGRLGAESRKILLVDDDAPLRKNLVRAFEREGFEVATAGSLKEAYDVANDFSPDFAVLDLNLQDGYGMELVGTLQDLRPGVRIVILTGYDSIASSLVALKAGAVGYLAKPVQAEQVVATLMGQATDSIEPAERPMSADRVRWEHIQRVFEQCSRNVSETARRLNMHRRTLQRILSKRAPRP
jgi:two-component system, response regulator RegA